jgi:hypothetical protein
MWCVGAVDFVAKQASNLSSKSRRSGLVDAVVITTGEEAYRRSDGIAVVPASLLGP